ncbi:MAG: hypothetical protein GY906_28905 [bacterium]|nr:hypothetical protein [bacterium]
MESYFGVAEEVGLTKDEIGSVQAIVMAVSAGRVGAQFRQATSPVRKKGQDPKPTSPRQDQED